MAYSDKVIDHYENPRNVGKWEPDTDGVGTGMVGVLVVMLCDYRSWWRTIESLMQNLKPMVAVLQLHHHHFSPNG